MSISQAFELLLMLNRKRDITYFRKIFQDNNNQEDYNYFMKILSEYMSSAIWDRCDRVNVCGMLRCDPKFRRIVSRTQVKLREQIEESKRLNHLINGGKINRINIQSNINREKLKEEIKKEINF